MWKAQLKKNSQFEFPATTSLCTHENQRLILTRYYQIAPLDQQKRAIWGNQAKKNCGFLRMERDQLHFFGFFTHVHCEG